jgi:hypothetical protein
MRYMPVIIFHFFFHYYMSVVQRGFIMIFRACTNVDWSNSPPVLLFLILLLPV